MSTPTNLSSVLGQGIKLNCLDRTPETATEKLTADGGCLKTEESATKKYFQVSGLGFQGQDRSSVSGVRERQTPEPESEPEPEPETRNLTPEKPFLIATATCKLERVLPNEEL